MGKKKGGGVRIKQVGPKMPPPALTNPMEALMKPPTDPEDQIMYNPPNRKFQIVWPIHESFSMQTEGFQVIYPSYLDKDKSIGKGGRRIGLEKAVPCPTVNDISMALQQLSCRHVLQPYKGYSRDPTTLWDNPGRVLVDVQNYSSKKQLLLEIAARIPNLPERQKRLEEEEEKRLEDEQKQQEALALSKKKPVSGNTAAATGSSSASNKKRGKKGRKK